MKYIDESKLPEPPIGAHLVTRRPGYLHHGLYIGNGKVIHYSGMAKTIRLKDLLHLSALFHYGTIVRTSLKFFCDGHGFTVVEHPNARFSGSEAVERAKKRLCERSYYFLSNNCEHFVNWCLEDEFKSPYATKLILKIALILATLQWLVSGKTMHSSNRDFQLIFGTLCALSGAYVSCFFTEQTLQPAEGIRDREHKNRFYGRLGMRVGAVLGILLAIIGIRKKSRATLSIAPYLLPAITGLATYSISRSKDTKRKAKIREERLNQKEKTAQ